MRSKPANDMRKVEAFTRTSRWIDELGRALRAVHDAAWLSLLDCDELNEITRRFYVGSSPYLGEAHNLAGLFDWERGVVDRFFQDRRSVLVAAAGGGREVLGLARRGFRVDGFDCNPGLLSLARSLLEREHLAATLTLAAPDSVPVGLGLYDGGIVGHGAYMHMRGRRARIRFLEGFRRQLRPGAPIVVSFMMRGPSRRHDLILRIGRLFGVLRRTDTPVELGDTLVERFEHWFTKEELQAEVAEAGLEVEHFDPSPPAHLVARSAERSSGLERRGC